MDDMSEWGCHPASGSVWWLKTNATAQGATLVGLKHARVEEPHLLHLFSCQFWHPSLMGLIGAGPQPTTVSVVAKDIGCLYILAAGLSPLKEVYR